jgi:hypothetical protein
VKKFPQNAPADLVQKYRDLQKDEHDPIRTQLKTYLAKPKHEVFRKGPYKHKTVQQALDTICQLKQDINRRKLELEKQIKDAIDKAGASAVVSAQDSRRKVISKLKSAIDDLESQGTDLRILQDVFEPEVSGLLLSESKGLPGSPRKSQEEMGTQIFQIPLV